MADARKTPPPVRSVDGPLAPKPLGAKITSGGRPGSSVRKSSVQPWEREVLLALARAPAVVDHLPALAVTMGEAGLVDVVEVETSWTVSITEKGRAALKNGWYPS